jgi:Domain of unknown function (DUF6265)
MTKFFIVLFTLMLTCVYSQTDLSQLDWLTGSWSRTNAKPGRSSTEIWEKKTNTLFVGRGISLRGSDTTFVEKLKIIVKGNTIFYVADVPENKEPIFFKATSIDKQSVVFENPQHDFPKKIAYLLDGNKLKAVVSGDGKLQEFWFERK